MKRIRLKLGFYQHPRFGRVVYNGESVPHNLCWVVVLQNKIKRHLLCHKSILKPL